MTPHQSDSSEQQAALDHIREAVGRELGIALNPERIALPGGASVQVNAASSDRSVFCELFARQGGLKGGQRHKIANDVLKLLTLQRSFPDARLVLAFGDPEAAAFATSGSWLAEAIRTWGVEVLVVTIDPDVRQRVRVAQERQRMVNRESDSGGTFDPAP